MEGGKRTVECLGDVPFEYGEVARQ
jgi:hypothetical protein